MVLLFSAFPAGIFRWKVENYRQRGISHEVTTNHAKTSQSQTLAMKIHYMPWCWEDDISYISETVVSHPWGGGHLFPLGTWLVKQVHPKYVKFIAFTVSFGCQWSPTVTISVPVGRRCRLHNVTEFIILFSRRSNEKSKISLACEK